MNLLQSTANFFSSAPHFLLGGEDLDFGRFHLVVLACVLRATTKKGQTFLEKKCTPIENAGCACEFAHPWKNPAGTHVCLSNYCSPEKTVVRPFICNNGDQNQ